MQQDQGADADSFEASDDENSTSTTAQEEEEDGGANDNSEHLEKAVMKTLKRYVCFSVFDVIVIIFVSFHCYSLGKIFTYLYNLVCGYWIPLLVIRGSFRQMEKFGRCSC